MERAETFGKQEGRTIVIDPSLCQRERASLIGATRENVNGELRVLREDGSLCTMGNKIRIFVMDVLRRWAQ